MNTVIYYFSGTGNAFALARRLKELIPATEIRPITARETADLDGVSNLGLVFPVYAYGPPRIVEEFIGRLQPARIAYAFAAATCAGIPAGTLRRVGRLLRGRRIVLEAGFAVRDPSSSLAQDGERDAIQRLMIAANAGRTPGSSTERLEEIAGVVGRRERRPLEAGNLRTRLLGGALNRLARRSFPSASARFHVAGACTGCGRCAALCPRGIIGMDEGRPVWKGACEFCHACIQWCPAEAIEYGRTSIGKRRYRNPAVEAGDLIAAAREE